MNRSTIYRWFIEFAPPFCKKVMRYQIANEDSSSPLDEAYAQVRGHDFTFIELSTNMVKRWISTYPISAIATQPISF